MTTIKDAIKAIEALRKTSHKKKSIADKLLGKYKGIVPKGKTSTEFIHELRNSLYDKS